MKEKFIRFMQGRYGIDQLSKFLLIVGLVIVLISAFLGNNPTALILYLIGWTCVIYCYFRVFSRKCEQEVCREPGVSGKDIRDQELFPETEKYMAAEESISYLYVPVMQTEDPYTEGQGQDRSKMSEMRYYIYQKELIGRKSNVRSIQYTGCGQKCIG